MSTGTIAANADARGPRRPRGGGAPPTRSSPAPPASASRPRNVAPTARSGSSASPPSSAAAAAMKSDHRDRGERPPPRRPGNPDVAPLSAAGLRAVDLRVSYRWRSSPGARAPTTGKMRAPRPLARQRGRSTAAPWAGSRGGRPLPLRVTRVNAKARAGIGAGSARDDRVPVLLHLRSPGCEPSAADPTICKPTRGEGMPQKRIYSFGGGKAEGNKDMKEALGGKGAGLAEMSNIGIPVPPGLHDHDRRLHRVLPHRQEAPARARGRAARRARRRSRRSPARASATPRTRCSSRSAPARASRCPG